MTHAHEDALRRYRVPVQLTPSIGAFYSAQHMAINFTVAGPFSDADMNDPGALQHAGKGADLFLASMAEAGIATLAEGVMSGRIGIASQTKASKGTLKFDEATGKCQGYLQVEGMPEVIWSAKEGVSVTYDPAGGVVPRSLATYEAEDGLPSIVRACSTVGNSERMFGWIRDKFAEAMSGPVVDPIRKYPDGTRSDSGRIQFGVIHDNHTQELAYQQINELRGQLSVLRTVATDAAIDVMLAHLRALTRLIKLTEKK